MTHVFTYGIVADIISSEATSKDFPTMHAINPRPVDEEAMIVPIGAPTETRCALLAGSLKEARERVPGMLTAEAA